MEDECCFFGLLQTHDCGGEWPLSRDGSEQVPAPVSVASTQASRVAKCGVRLRSRCPRHDGSCCRAGLLPFRYSRLNYPSRRTPRRESYQLHTLACCTLWPSHPFSPDARPRRIPETKASETLRDVPLRYPAHF